MTIREAVRQAAQQLECAGVPDPQIDAELIVEHVTGMDRLQMRMEYAHQLTAEQEQRLSSLLLSRTQRRPLQYVLGVQYFYGLPFEVDERVLVPRQETEGLCELGAAYLKRLNGEVSALDLCTGSGAIAVALKTLCPQADVNASDLSADALEVARKNAVRNGADVRFWQGDLFAPLEGRKFDLILSNPPYIPTQECRTLQPEVMQEPFMALDGGMDGLDFYRRIAQEARSHLSARGMLAVEAGDHEAEAIAGLFRAAGLCRVSIHNDLYGLPRMVAGFAEE